MIYILIPTFHVWDKLTTCIKALEDRTFSDEARLLISYENYNLGKPRGYPATTNDLIKAALLDPDCSEIVVVNSDAYIMTDHWLDKIHEYVKDRADVGIVEAMELLKWPDGDESGFCWEKRIHIGEGEPIEKPACGLGFTWIKREVFEKIGILDMRFNPGYFEDFDFGMRSWLAGFRSVMLPSIYYKHERGGTFKELIEKGIMPPGTNNWKVFHEKWAWLIVEGEDIMSIFNKVRNPANRV